MVKSAACAGVAIMTMSSEMAAAATADLFLTFKTNLRTANAPGRARVETLTPSTV
ncbi:hypothetical protein CXY01_35940 [Cellulomonas xylanilytica]|uniref:Uncharacterized protein n=1 Tax=Cellulomonas xylanilytica TaxID=233583 RepID=A0A510V894_9CELL|nr:hypothetical protein CXY01_35940 [Cellulomonas xylanilytica]